MKAYRRYFIRLNMLLVGVVLLTTLVLAGVYIARSAYTNMRSTMQETLEPFNGENGSFSFTPGEPEGEPARQDVPRQKDGVEPPEGDMEPPEGSVAPSENDMEPPEGSVEPSEGGLEPPEDGSAPREEVGAPPEDRQEDAESATSSHCVTIFYEEGAATIISGNDGGDDDALLAAADAAAAAEESSGYLQDGDFYYLRMGGTSSAKVCLYPAQYLRASLLRTGAYLLGAFALTMLACYFISRYISGLAVRPVQQAMDRERQFVADISHDLKTPMTVVRSCVRIIQENPAQTVAEAKPWLDRSSDALENMGSLIDDMLTLSAMDSARRLPKRERVNLSSVVTKAVLQMDVTAYERGISLSSEIRENVFVNGDDDALLRITAGLIENALKYEPEGGSVAVALEERGKRVVLTVRNFGAFIAPEDLPHIFERFYRGDKARTARQGHGLGLAIIRRTAELMGAKVEASSAPETGTCFTVTFV